MTDITIIGSGSLEADITIITDGSIETVVTSVGLESITLVESGTVVISGGVIGATNYTHTQSVAADIWIVNHNLGFRPAVRALTVGGVEVMAEVIHASSNQLFIYFDFPLAGQAICS